MSTFLHDVHQKWLKNAVLDWLDMGMSKPEAKYLNVAVGTSKYFNCQ